ncbi:ABC transporter permease [Glycomyces harbinensis]|uniref:ABC-type nitrate/sulfonate/bicarbonate transport system, permease component n=1 Tax=Glycomyces harbinensis TaxID=58114 RepID=A0A1G6TM06_9ACTN|nr:ABC transporter permease subunit [Glycomyces harbinensis]SDD29355.1 ABC-type nitrate/sulfonate/bicarbonate transport system, permease component [Glycomyces harbinensis]
MNLLRRALALTALPAILLGAWWIASDGSTSFYFPPLREILAEFGETWTADRWAADVLPSVARLGAGYGASCLLGVGLGLLIGRTTWLMHLAEPVLEFARAVPPPVLVPVIMLFAGIGDTMKTAVIVSGCVWPILLNTIAGVRSADAVQLDTAAAFGLGRTRTLVSVVVPAASPRIVTGMRQALAVGVILMVISEMFAAQSGLGFAIVQFQRSYAIPAMWSGILLLGCLGVALAALFTLFDRAVLHWYHRMRERSA